VLCGPRTLCFLRRPEPSRRCSSPQLFTMDSSKQAHELPRTQRPPEAYRFIDATVESEWHDPSERHSSADVEHEWRRRVPQSTTRAQPRTATDQHLGLPRPGPRRRRPWRSHATSMPHGGDGEQEPPVELVHLTRHHCCPATSSACTAGEGMVPHLAFPSTSNKNSQGVQPGPFSRRIRRNCGAMVRSLHRLHMHHVARSEASGSRHNTISIMHRAVRMELTCPQQISYANAETMREERDS
jgi:hypothetical protein